MDRISKFSLQSNQAAFWFLGQAGYIFRSAEVTVVIDPYLSDSAAAGAPECQRLHPVPIAPKSLKADLYIVTHCHLDHLDPGTVGPYQHKQTTMFVAPRNAARSLVDLGVPGSNISVIEAGDVVELSGVRIEGVFALPTGVDVLDTTGYRIDFKNRRNVYHSSDTAYNQLLLEAAPKGVELLLVPINGKWRNLTVEQACDLTDAVKPKYVVPNHYDMMAINSENPETFRYFLTQRGIGARCMIPEVMHPFVWE